MIKAYFISDLHIGANETEEEHQKQTHVLRFLDEIEKDATHLYIVGDLFDFWFEYKYVIPKKYFDFLYRFKRLTDRGVEINYLAGNHDFFLGRFFDEMIGMKTWLDDYEFELGGKNFYLFHGDGVAKKDTGYRFLKRVFRNKFNQKIFRWLHPDFGFRFARFISGSSRVYTNRLVLKDVEDYKEYAEKQFDRGFDYVLMGHKHNPLVYEKNDHKYLNLGDWLVNFSYAEFDGNNLELKYYPLKK
ncbi:MAG: UDP-2,3-diacylglucosamine diphosphatase [Calditrichaceae bacterium]